MKDEDSKFQVAKDYVKSESDKHKVRGMHVPRIDSLVGDESPILRALSPLT